MSQPDRWHVRGARGKQLGATAHDTDGRDTAPTAAPVVERTAASGATDGGAGAGVTAPGGAGEGAGHFGIPG